MLRYTNENILSNNINIELIEEAFSKIQVLHNREHIQLKSNIKPIIQGILTKLEMGELRVAFKDQQEKEWKINLWVKKAILLGFALNDNQLINSQPSNYFDKLAPRFHNADYNLMQSIGARIIPPACIRTGAFIAKNTIIMPSFINIGAFVDEGTMIDSWATIGSCAQIGKNVHISSGVTIGGVLEPLQDNPVIIEDNCFIGANSAIVEGIIIEANSVISTGVMLSKSTKIYHRQQDCIIYGKIPSGSVVVPGTINHNSDHYNYGINCAIIAKQVDLNTLSKTSINEILREIF